MKIFHVSDLHIGKILNGYSLQENQQAVLDEIVKAAESECPDVILICGDIYDRSAPSGDAFTMFDGFLNQLANVRPSIPVLVIAGNHDSPERLAYASSFLERHRIYLSVFPPKNEEEHLKKITLEDEYGPVDFYLMPFLKPGYVRGVSEEEITDYESAVRVLLEREKIDYSKRNVILSHQFYVGEGGDTQTCDSEQAVIMAGGLDKVSAGLLKNFDYGALGHIHGRQQAGFPWIRYSGTPYKYSVSEEKHEKSITVVELGTKGQEAKISFFPLKGVQDVRRIKGKLEEVLAMASEGVCHDFVSITLCDEDENFHVRERLEERYDHILEIRVDNRRTREKLEDEIEEVKDLNPEDAFEMFYEAVQHVPMSQQEKTVMGKILREVGEGAQQ